jgi:hypothetical protein
MPLILIVHSFRQVSARNGGAALPKPGADVPCGQRPAARGISGSRNEPDSWARIKSTFRKTRIVP